MIDYTFETLNDKEFEDLANDLFEAYSGIQVERFKAGKDFGIDGRFDFNGGIGIIQSKHWLKSGLSKLLTELKNKEAYKALKLDPSRYVFFTSLALSAADKEKIQSIFYPYILSTSDIFGKDEINSLIGKFPNIERSHFKLWLSSINVLNTIVHSATLNKSGYILQSALDNKCFYVQTINHSNAVRKIESIHTIIITGDPGVGKTTLAEQVSLKYVAEGYDFICISDSIDEAYGLIDKERKQLFYFDDFLGSNYLTAIRNKEDSKVVRFIEAVRRNPHCRFILTSRTSILNQGKIFGHHFITGNIEENEYELRADNLSYYEKGEILYNRIWHSNLHELYVEEIYRDKKYHSIIGHKNFNPRIIQYLTDPLKVKNIHTNLYWDHICDSLNNPKDIWDHPFTVQLDEFERNLVRLVVFNGNSICEDDYIRAFDQYNEMCDLKSYRPTNIDQSFNTGLRVVTKSFVDKFINGDVVSYKLANPSIADYVLSKHSYDENIFKALQTSASIAVLVDVFPEHIEACLLNLISFSLNRRKGNENNDYLKLLFSTAVENNIDVSLYTAEIFDLLFSNLSEKEIATKQFFHLFKYLFDGGVVINTDLFERIFHFMKFEGINIEFYKYFISIVQSRSDLLKLISENEMKKKLVEYVEKNVDEILANTGAYDDIEPGYDSEDLYFQATISLSIYTEKFGLKIAESEIEEIVYELDCEQIVQDIISSIVYDNEDYYSHDDSHDFVAVDALFRRK